MDAEGHVKMQNQALRVLRDTCPPVFDRFGNPVTLDLRRTSGEPLRVDESPIIKALVDGEVTRGQELVARRADDHLVPLLVSAAPILMEGGKRAGAAMVVQDISAIKELERTREEWAAIVAHDLRQPISIISLRSALILRTPLNDQQREDVPQIRSAVDRLSRMTSDLMDAALLESHRMQVVLIRLDLGQLLHDVVKRVPRAVRRTTVRTPTECRVFVKGDAHRLEQVVTNLLANAVKYGTPDTEILVELTADDRQAEVVVANHGPGIPPDELPHVFERYVRSRAPRAHTAKGLGLGLYIAKGLVLAHGGRIRAESIPDDVTRFHISIPLDGPPVTVPPAGTS
jgi:signal transduction histidine kinase